MTTNNTDYEITDNKIIISESVQTFEAEAVESVEVVNSQAQLLAQKIKTMSDNIENTKKCINTLLNQGKIEAWWKKGENIRILSENFLLMNENIEALNLIIQELCTRDAIFLYVVKEALKQIAAEEPVAEGIMHVTDLLEGEIISSRKTECKIALIKEDIRNINDRIIHQSKDIETLLSKIEDINLQYTTLKEETIKDISNTDKKIKIISLEYQNKIEEIALWKRKFEEVLEDLTHQNTQNQSMRSRIKRLNILCFINVGLFLLVIFYYLSTNLL